jgi:hypothetical protein
MALKPCCECKELVSEKAKSCPNCGAADPLGLLALSKAAILTGGHITCCYCSYVGWFIAEPIPNISYILILGVLLGVIYMIAFFSFPASIIGGFIVFVASSVAMLVAYALIILAISLFLTIKARLYEERTLISSTRMIPYRQKNWDWPYFLTLLDKGVFVHWGKCPSCSKYVY